MTAPVAAVDCGTNTVKLLVGRFVDGELVTAVRESRVVRLGEGVDATGRLSEAALARTFAVLDDYAALLRSHGVTRVRFCATSATRDADNAATFAAGVRERIGVDPEVLDGAEEAALAYAGARRAVRRELGTPVLVVDIGGGSTELVLGEDEPTASVSLDIGSVRLSERHLHSDPPTAAEVEACIADITASLDDCGVPLEEAASVVGIAGTVTTVAAGVLGLTAYDRDAIDQAVLAVADVHETVERLVALTVAERKALGYVHPGRADVIDAGALILSRVLRRTGLQTMLVSESDILEGIAWSMA